MKITRHLYATITCASYERFDVSVFVSAGLFTIGSGTQCLRLVAKNCTLIYEVHFCFLFCLINDMIYSFKVYSWV